jgi:hypothetical protein
MSEKGENLDGQITPHRFIEGRCGHISVGAVSRPDAVGGRSICFRWYFVGKFASHISLFQRSGP